MCNCAYILEAVKAKVSLHHPDSDDLAFLYGTIVTDGEDAFSDKPTVNLTVFADREVSVHTDQLTAVLAIDTNYIAPVVVFLPYATYYHSVVFAVLRFLCPSVYRSHN